MWRRREGNRSKFLPDMTTKGAPVAACLVAFVLLSVSIGPAFARQNNDELGRMFESTISLYEGGDYVGALRQSELLYVSAVTLLGIDHPNTLLVENLISGILVKLNDYDAAETITVNVIRRSSAINGPNAPDTLSAISNLGTIYEDTGRLELAETQYLAAFNGFSRTRGPHDEQTLAIACNIAGLYVASGNPERAVDEYSPHVAAAVAELGSFHPVTLACNAGYAGALAQSGRYPEALSLLEEVVDQSRRNLGENNPNTLSRMTQLANFAGDFGQFSYAERLHYDVLQRALEEFGPATAFSNRARFSLSAHYQEVGNLQAAEPLLREGLAWFLETLGPGHPDTLKARNNLALMLMETGVYAAALQQHIEVWETRKALLGNAHPDSISSLMHIAETERRLNQLGRAAGRYSEAIELTTQALGATHRLTLNAQNNLALIQLSQGQLDEAISRLQIVVAAREQALGLSHPHTLAASGNLAIALDAAGRHMDAAPIHARVVAGMHQVFGPVHPSTITAVLDFSENGVATGSSGSSSGRNFASNSLAEALSIFASRYSVEEPNLTDQSNPTSQVALSKRALSAFTNFNVVAQRRNEFHQLTDPAFILAQSFVFSSAADALRASTAALTVDEPEARSLVEAINDASAALETAEAALSVLLSRPQIQQDPAAIRYARDRVTRALAELDRSNQSLAETDLDLAELALPRVADTGAIRNALGPDEALIFFADSTESKDLLAFLLTPISARAVPLNVNPEQLAAEVAAIRAGLDLNAGVDYRLSTSDLNEQPFDLAAAKRLHDLVFDPLRPYLGEATQLLVVADGPLQTLPLHILVSELPGAEVDGFDRYREARWLSDEFAFSRLPSVASLVALRREDTPLPAGSRKLLGFGDPVLADYHETDSTPVSSDGVFLQFANASGALSVEGLPSLRQTAALLREISNALNLATEDIRLGPHAVEAHLASLNDSGVLADYRTLVFATHALINDEIEGLDEPAIVLTPTEESDGLLRASEIVQLNLDAGLVILAACNTAAADGSPGAEALSGLAKAFFYAGARSLLVSNWPAEAGATAELIPDLVDGIEREGLPRSVALQRAMNRLRDEHAFDFYAHPALWAPYMVVADG